MVKKEALGKGLNALIGEGSKDLLASSKQTKNTSSSQANEKDTILHISIDDLCSGPFQPRKLFDSESLQELAESIKENGILQPILVAKNKEAKKGDPRYTIIAGERRWRAAQLANLTEIPAIRREYDNKHTLQAAIIENIQREDLTIIEEAEGFQRLIEEFSYTQEQLAEIVGKSRSHVTNILRLLELPEQVQEYLNLGKLTMGHARALVKTEDPTGLAEEIILKQLSVRQAEEFAKGRGTRKNKNKSTTSNDNSEKSKSLKSSSSSKEFSPNRDPDLHDIEKMLTSIVGFPVTINESGVDGVVSIYYKDLGELDEILQKLSHACKKDFES